MKYRLSSRYLVDFTAYAPLHTFRGQAEEGIEGEMDIDFDALTLVSARARADVRKFTTLDRERDQALHRYMDPDTNPEAAIEMTRVDSFQRIDDQHYQVNVFAVLFFMGIRRQMPISFTLFPDDTAFTIKVTLQWSFSAYGLKTPRLLFLKVRDIVDIRGKGVFTLDQEEQTP